MLIGSMTRPVPVLSGSAVRLFLTSATLLFVELLLIRWIPANVVYVGFFSNFLLMASFLGIGAGILFGRDPHRLPISPFAPVLLAVVFLVTHAQLNVKLGSPNEIFFGLAESRSADANYLVLPMVFVLVTIVMAALAVPLGTLLTSMAPLRAYAIDIAGSMAGIAVFTVLSALGTEPTAWFVVLATLLSIMALGAGLTRWSIVSAVSMAGVIGVAAVAGMSGDEWSPYYRISRDRVEGATHLSVNGIPHQVMRSTKDPHREPWYDQVDRWFPDRRFDSVLIVGAGSGTDTSFALANGAGSVDAVDIDPVIQRVGVEEHPDRPYSDPRVARHVDDGRAFLRKTTSRYDLVIFALPDSLTLVSTSANLRLESFLFTTEAFESVRDHLAPDGVFVLYNYYRQQWLIDKLAGMLEAAFGSPPIVHSYSEVGNAAAVLAAGPGADALRASDADGSFDPVDRPVVPGPARDDWPFLYLREPGTPTHYVIALALVLLWAVLLVGRAVARSGTSVRRFSPHFFLLGIAFLLLETRSLVTFSLLFGSTWVVNSFVFFAILASVLAAIGVNARFRIRDPRPLYIALFASLLIGYLLPPASLLLEPAWLRYGVASALAFAPVFFANLVFSYSFRDTRTADMAFASNVLGAMVGGAFEYVALASGYQALLIGVAMLYGLAYVAAARLRFLADRDLESGPAVSVEPAAAEPVAAEPAAGEMEPA